MSQLRAPSAGLAKTMRARIVRRARAIRPAAGCGLRLLSAPVLSTLALCALALPRAAANTALSACPTVGTSRAAIANIDERLEITLKDGRTLRLAGIEPPRPTPERPDFDMAARDALRARSGTEIDFVPLAERPDRWGRVASFVFFDQPGATPVSAGQFLLAGGFARFMPEPEARACRALFLVAEATARAAGLGLWSDPFYSILVPTDRDAFAERAATNVIVEGRLLGLDQGRWRTYLEFAPRPAHDFEVTILQRNVRKFEQAGFDFPALVGQTLRVRGLLDLRFGPHLEISSPDEIELIPEPRRDRPLGAEGSASPP
jgi:endonuclease YncB( thermonuclease family)